MSRRSEKPKCLHVQRRVTETENESTFRCERCGEVTTAEKMKSRFPSLTKPTPLILCVACGTIARASSFRADDEECHSCFWKRVDENARRRP